jgi:hypothetical protein
MRVLACAGFEAIECTHSPKVTFTVAKAVPLATEDHSPFQPPPRRIAAGPQHTNDFAITFED